VRRILWLLLLITAVSPASAEDTLYNALVRAAKESSQPVDWQALRFAYAETSQFDPFGAETQQIRKKMFDALTAHDAAAALSEADHILEGNYVDIAAHMAADIASHHLGDDGRSDREHDIVVGLLRSFGPGDGHSPETAFTVISITEEYDFLRILGYKVRQQAVISASGHAYDRFEADRDGQSVTLYFLADRVLAAESELFQPKP
jgi:hypothetical protein